MRFDQQSTAHPDNNLATESGGHSSDRDKNKLKLGSRYSRSVIANRQVLSMIVVLIMVVYAMHEAGKPERWHWLFPPATTAPSENQFMIVPAANGTLDSRHQEPQSLLDETLENPIPGQHIAATAVAQPLKQNQVEEIPIAAETTREDRPLALSYPAAAIEFWQDLIRRFSPKQRDEFYFILKRIRDGQPCPQLQQENLSQLVDQIKQSRNSFHEQLFQKLAFTSSEKKEAITNRLFESQQVWQSLEEPALDRFVTDQNPTEPQRQQLELLQRMIDETFYEFVQDKTAQGWEGDSPAWARIWEQLIESPAPPATPTTHLELSSQPNYYRGKMVELRGWVRAARQEALTVKELDILQMYVLVVRPEDSKASPYFVYTDRLPPHFPQLNDRYASMNEGVSIRGRFFKIRSYLDTENKVQHSPMILTTDVQPWSPAGLAATESDANDFIPTIALALLILPLLAAFVAWWLFRVTDIIRFRPGTQRTSEIHRELAGLAENPDIKTEKERVNELYHESPPAPEKRPD